MAGWAYLREAGDLGGRDVRWFAEVLPRALGLDGLSDWGGLRRGVVVWLSVVCT